MRSQEFKDTKIGNIPKEWEATRLGDIVSLEYGSGLTEAQRKHGRYPVYGSNGVIGYHDNFLIEGPGIVVGRKGTIGAVNWSDRNYWPIDTTYFVKLIDNKTYLRWLYYKLTSLNLAKLNTATGTPGLNRDLAYSQTFPLPPLPEQQKIAKILSTADEAIQKVDEAVEKTQRLKQGLMQELLTKGIGHKEFKETEIGRIPKEWEVAKIGDICDQRNEIIQPTREGAVKFVGLEHIESGKTSITSFATDANVKSSKFKFHKGDILYGKLRPYLDKAVITDFEGICSTDLLVLNPGKTKGDSGFLIYTLHSDRFLSHAISTTSGTNHPRTSWKAIAKFKLPLPPLPEQQKISEILSAVDNRLGLLRKKKEKLERTKQGLMNDLLTGKKRVRLES